jgi:hypothetical protein
VNDETVQRAAGVLGSTADRLDTLAETADLMGDSDGAVRFRAEAADCRLRAMSMLDRRE